MLHLYVHQGKNMSKFDSYLFMAGYIRSRMSKGARLKIIFFLQESENSL